MVITVNPLCQCAGENKYHTNKEIENKKNWNKRWLTEITTRTTIKTTKNTDVGYNDQQRKETAVKLELLLNIKMYPKPFTDWWVIMSNKL